MSKKIFIVDDDSLNIFLISRVISINFPAIEFKCFECIEDIKAEINSFGFPDFIISDYNMPPNQEDGIDFVLWLLKKKYINFIMWTNNVNQVHKKITHTEINVFEKDDFNGIKERIKKIL